MKKTIISLLLLVCLTLSSCTIPGLNFPPVLPSDEDFDVNDAPLNEELDGSQSSSSINKYTLKATVVKGEPTDLSELLPEGFDKSSAVWESACEGIATVSDGTVTGVKYGRTEITATSGSAVQTIIVTVEFLTSTNNGYHFPTRKDTETHKVSSVYEADRLLDNAIATHVSEITIDFSKIGGGFVASEDYGATLELSSHVSITRKWYETRPNVLKFEIKYETDTASEYTEPTAANNYASFSNANMIIRNAEATEARADDFENFPINLNNSGTMDVYNSEELWWALQNNLKPVFPLRNSKAELFYERAKMLLRDIVTDSMSDFDKILAIHDALVDTVAYDYDAADDPETDDFHRNVCYYLEGVFERGVAVCDGKAKAFVLLCGIEGIRAVRDFGDSRDGGAGHAWNYVELWNRWYLVDTTAADVAYGSNTSFGRFANKAVEITLYDTFLVSVDALKYEYVYSGIWNELPVGNNPDSPYLYLTDYINDDGTNFYIDCKGELVELIEILVSQDLCDECVLTFAISPDAYYNNLPFDAADEALPLGATYDIYVMDIGGIENYFMLIKGI